MWFDVSYLLSSPISFSPIYHMKREFSKVSSSSRSSSSPVCVVPGLCLYTPVTAGTQNTYPKSYSGTKKIMKWKKKKKRRGLGVIYWYPRRWDRKGKYRGQWGDFAVGNRASLRTFSSSRRSAPLTEWVQVLWPRAVTEMIGRWMQLGQKGLETKVYCSSLLCTQEKNNSCIQSSETQVM